MENRKLILSFSFQYPQHTTEWAIPYENAQACLREFRDYLQKEFQDPNGIRPHFPVEVRFSAADDIWLSPSYGQRTCWIGIVQYKYVPCLSRYMQYFWFWFFLRPYGYNVPYRKLFQAYEDIVGRYQGRPHWAKAHQLGPDSLQKLYPHFGEFRRVIEDVDPKGIFRNDYVQRHIMGHSIGRRIYKKNP